MWREREEVPGEGGQGRYSMSCTQGPDTTSVTVLFCQKNDTMNELICLAMLCGVWLYNVPFSDIPSAKGKFNVHNYNHR